MEGAHYLQLKPDKIEIQVFASPADLHELSIKGVFINSETCVWLSPVAKNLGFRRDTRQSAQLQGTDQATEVFFETLKLRDLVKIKSFLATRQMNTLVQAIITSR